MYLRRVEMWINSTMENIIDSKIFYVFDIYLEYWVNIEYWVQVESEHLQCTRSKLQEVFLIYIFLFWSPEVNGRMEL